MKWAGLTGFTMKKKNIYLYMQSSMREIFCEITQKGFKMCVYETMEQYGV